MTEAELQRLIIDAADMGGWLVFHATDMRRSRAGFPDLVLLRPPELIVVELKTEKGRVRPDQAIWLDALEGIQVMSSGIIRPDDADALVDRLVRKWQP